MAESATNQALTIYKEADLERAVDQFLDGDQVTFAGSRLHRAVREADALTVVSNADDYEQAHGLIAKVKDRQKALTEMFDRIARPFHLAHRRITGAAREPRDAADAATGRLTVRASTWRREQERMRQEQLRRERQEREDAERREREVEAQRLEEEGAPEEAEAVREAPSIAPPPARPLLDPVVPQQTAVTMRKTWKAEVTDLKALCAAVGRGDVPPQAVKANPAYLNKRASADKDMLSIPGVRAYSAETAAARRK